MDLKSILLVEDDERMQMLGRKLLEHRGYAVTVVGDGLAAVEAARGGEFHLVLMDMSLPVMDGVSATRRIKATRADLPVLAVTARAMEEERLRALAAGCDGFISKPYSAEELLSAIEAHLPGSA